MDQALSLWFLLGWIGGDSCNLIGSFLADQLPLQVGGSLAQQGREGRLGVGSVIQHSMVTMLCKDG